MSALLPVFVISATLVALFGIVLPLLLLGPVMASRARPQPQQLLFAVMLLIPSVAIGSVFLSWWAISWLESTEAPAPVLVGIALVVAATVGLLAPLRLPGRNGPFWLKPLLGLGAGVLVPVAVMESIVVGLHEAAATAVGVVVLAVLIGVFRVLGRPLAEHRRAKQARDSIERFQGQLVDVDDQEWRLTGARGDADRIVLHYDGEQDGKKLGARLLLERDMDWVPTPKENEAAVFELARGLGGQPTEAVLAQKELGTPATLTLRIPGTTVLSIRETVADSLSWVEFVGKLELIDADAMLQRRMPTAEER
ncbi:hypothetical protein [Glycomyces xiaoerkulensis]|uniref:hypothetical protein n=1 Tax=Glycomyces xiaoerkulensis TaxID=2038139 RepID=UPI0012FFEC47|nr:hypothetical protein [Glycomyces xiaoerkulensis]